MAAGLGFKTFVSGEVLTAADTNGYLMQGILDFASEAARNSAITSPQEGQFAFTKDTNSLWYYDGAAWVASGATGDIEGVTAGVGISGGGTSGTVTVTNSMATAIDAKGDLIGGTGADAFSRLAVGANNTVLTADSAEATGLKWATPAGGSSFAGCRLFNTTDQSITNATATAVTFNSESFDVGGYHTGSSSRITIPSAKDGYYQFSGASRWPGGSSTGLRAMYLYKNGTEVWAGTFQAPSNTTINETLIYTQIVSAVATDYFELFVYQSTGGAYDVSGGTAKTTFQATYLGA